MFFLIPGRDFLVREYVDLVKMKTPDVSILPCAFSSIQFVFCIIYPHFFVEPLRRSSAVRSKLTDAVISQYSALPHSPLTAALTMGTRKKVQSSGRAE